MCQNIPLLCPVLLQEPAHTIPDGPVVLHAPPAETPHHPDSLPHYQTPLKLGPRSTKTMLWVILLFLTKGTLLSQSKQFTSDISEANQNKN